MLEPDIIFSMPTLSFGSSSDRINLVQISRGVRAYNSDVNCFPELCNADRVIRLTTLHRILLKQGA